jgi:ABC-type multidrug transport system fused ATPase/permease subunit
MVKLFIFFLNIFRRIYRKKESVERKSSAYVATSFYLLTTISLAIFLIISLGRSKIFIPFIFKSQIPAFSYLIFILPFLFVILNFISKKAAKKSFKTKRKIFEKVNSLSIFYIVLILIIPLLEFSVYLWMYAIR